MKEAKEKKTRRTLYQLFFKRFFTIILSLILIVVLSPVLLIVWVVLLFALKGNPVFAQYRPGKNGKVFKFYKFRSMTNATDENGDLLPDAQRITKIGKFIRKTGIDELPQLFNILKGDMSFIGPRPRLIEDMIFYDKEVLEGYTVRPGVTGPDQVLGGRSNASWEEIFEADVKYARRITFWGDIKILFKTVKCVFKPEAAGAGAEESKREYYYRDYQLKTGKITKEQYALGMARSRKLKTKGGKVEFQPDLHGAEENVVTDNKA